MHVLNVLKANRNNNTAKSNVELQRPRVFVGVKVLVCCIPQLILMGLRSRKLHQIFVSQEADKKSNKSGIQLNILALVPRLDFNVERI